MIPRIIGIVLAGMLALAWGCGNDNPMEAADDGNGGTTIPGQTVLLASMDNTLYEDAEGDVSNGAGHNVFTGVTGVTGLESIRRAVIRFPVADSIPVGAKIDSVRLELFATRVAPGSGGTVIRLHAVSRSWGEAGSVAFGPGGGGGIAEMGDATWKHAFFDTTAWTNAGGDFAATESGVATITAADATYAWGSSAMVADVQAWVDHPDSNFGWILIGDEAGTQNAVKFNSRESAQNPPRLIIKSTK